MYNLVIDTLLLKSSFSLAQSLVIRLCRLLASPFISFHIRVEQTWLLLVSNDLWWFCFAILGWSVELCIKSSFYRTLCARSKSLPNISVVLFQLSRYWKDDNLIGNCVLLYFMKHFLESTLQLISFQMLCKYVRAASLWLFLKYGSKYLLFFF